MIINYSATAKSVATHVLPLHRLEPGLYWVTQRSPTKGVDHHAILDVGNRMGYLGGCRQPIIVHQTPPSIRRESVEGTGYWNILKKIADERDAVRRLLAACENPAYSVVGNNCEHFARYIATGVRESHQVQLIGFIGAIFGLVLIGANG